MSGYLPLSAHVSSGLMTLLRRRPFWAQQPPYSLIHLWAIWGSFFSYFNQAYITGLILVKTKLTKLCQRVLMSKKEIKFAFASCLDKRNGFWMPLGAWKKDVSFAKTRVSTPCLLRSPFGEPHLPTPLRRRRLWMVRGHFECWQKQGR